MKKLLTTLLLTPVAIAACGGGAGKAPEANATLCAENLTLKVGTYEKSFELYQQGTKPMVAMKAVIEAGNKVTLSWTLESGSWQDKEMIKKSLERMKSDLGTSICSSNWTVLTGGTTSYNSVLNATNELLTMAV